MGKGKEKAFKVVTILVVVAILVCALWIMGNHLGLVQGYDFGAGAYYYADIPDFEKYTEAASLPTRIPYLVYVGLFLLWGWLMYRLWKRIDK